MRELADIATLTLNPALDVTTATATLNPGHKLRCDPPHEDPGGGGVNVARALRQMGASALAVFSAGGATGKRVETLLAAAAVPCACVQIAGTTRESFTVDETTTGRQYRFVLPGPSLSMEEQNACLRTLEQLDPQPRWLVLSGSLPPGVSAGLLLRVGLLCRKSGIELLVDSTGPVLACFNGLDAALVKPSLSELEGAVGRTLASEREEAAAARELVERRVARAVVVSLGARGALLVTAADEQRFPAIPVNVRSTVGAGDSMMAGITLGLSRGLELAEAVRLGTATGAAALIAPGTSLAHRADVERLFGQPLPSGLRGDFEAEQVLAPG